MNCFLRSVGIILLFLSTQISDAQPRYQWAKRAGGYFSDNAKAITLDHAGNVYTTGNFDSLVDFDPGAGVHQLQAIGYNDMFVQKLDNQGNFVWAVCISSATTNAASDGSSIQTDEAGNVYIAGSFLGQNTDFDPGAGLHTISSTGTYSTFVLKLNSAGQFMWAKSMGGMDAIYPLGLAVDKAGNIITCGNFNSTVDFNPSIGTYNLTSKGSYDGFVQKMDSAGNFIWAITIGGRLTDVANTIVLDSLNNVYIGGGFEDTVDFDPGLGVVQRIGVYGYDKYLMKINDLGSLVWVSTNAGIETDQIEAVCTDGKRYIYATGYNDREFFITKYDTLGTNVWEKKFYGGAGVTHSDVATGIAVDDTGNVYTSGYFTGSVDFDPGSNQVFRVAPGPALGGITDIFILKLSNTGNYKWVQTIGIANDESSEDLYLDKWNDIYVTGTFFGNVDFNPGLGADSLYGIGYKDMFVLKLAQCINTYDTVNLSACDSIVLNGIAYTTSGTYIQSLMNYRGCDSIITVNVSIRRNYVTIANVLCTGDTFQFGTNTLTVGGIYYDTLSNTYGCDSIIQLTLTEFPVITRSIVDTICFGSAYSYNGTTLTASGAYPFTFTSITGCDSIVTIKLTVRPALTTVIDAVICNEDKYNFGGHLLNVPDTYTDTLSSVIGCDSVIILNLAKRIINTVATVSGNVCVAEEDSISYQWAECTNGSFNIINDATEQMFIAPANGSYLCILLTGMCKELTNCVTVTGVGISGVAENDVISIYPNPAQDAVTIYHNSSSGIYFKLLNVQGEVVKNISCTNASTLLNMSDLSEGIYVALLFDKDNLLIHTEKVLKQ